MNSTVELKMNPHNNFSIIMLEKEYFWTINIKNINIKLKQL